MSGQPKKKYLLHLRAERKELEKEAMTEVYMVYGEMI